MTFGVFSKRTWEEFQELRLGSTVFFGHHDFFHPPKVVQIEVLILRQLSVSRLKQGSSVDLQ